MVSGDLRAYMSPVISINISAEAFEAISRTMPFGSVSYEAAPDANGQVKIWLEPHILAKLRAIRWPKQSYSDVNLRLAAEAGYTSHCFLIYLVITDDHP